MNRNIPPVSKYMTPMPYTIDADASLAQASDLMKEYKIHHLPVRSGLKTVGVLSSGNVNLLAMFHSVDLNSTRVESAMTRSPYCVTPDTALDFVALHMAEQRISSALIIQENGTLVGIFTEADGLRALAELLQMRAHK